MIAGAVRSILTSSQTLIYSAEEKIRIAAKNKAQEEVLKTLPNPSTLQNDLGNMNPNNLEDLRKAQESYNRLRNICDSNINKLENYKAQVNQIVRQLDVVDRLFAKMQDIINIAQPLIPILRDAIPVAVSAAISAQVPPAISGAAIDRAQQLRGTAKGKLVEFTTSLDFFNQRSSSILSQVSAMKSNTTTAIDNINISIDRIRGLCSQLETIYSQFISQLNNADQLDLEAAGIFNPIDATDDISTLIQNQSSPKNSFVELGIPSTNKTGYKFKV